MNFNNFKLVLDFYTNNNSICLLAIDKSTNEPYGKITTNLSLDNLPLNKFVVKNYSENKDWAVPFIQQFPAWFNYLGPLRHRANPNVVMRLPLYEITPEGIKHFFELTYNPRSDIYEAVPPLWDLYNKYCETKV
jgi:hypothetical protein